MDIKRSIGLVIAAGKRYSLLLREIDKKRLNPTGKQSCQFILYGPVKLDKWL